MGTEGYSEPSKRSNMELLTKIVNSFQLLTISAKISIFNVCVRYEYPSEGLPKSQNTKTKKIVSSLKQNIIAESGTTLNKVSI